VVKIGKQKSKKKRPTSKKKGRKASANRKEINVEAWIDRHIREFITLSGLDLLGLNIKEYKEVLGDILIQLFGSTTSYTNVKTLVKRYYRNKKVVDQIIASRLASRLERFSSDQLEYIIYNIGDSILYSAPQLYLAAREAGREDLINIMRAKWNESWLRKKGKVLPAPCPRCGFNSLMPDLTCLVCGAAVREDELKSYLGTFQLLKELIMDLECEGLSKLRRYDYVLLEDTRIKLPWETRNQIDIEIYLSSKEKNLIDNAFKEKCRQGEE